MLLGGACFHNELALFNSSQPVATQTLHRTCPVVVRPVGMAVSPFQSDSMSKSFTKAFRYHPSFRAANKERERSAKFEDVQEEKREKQATAAWNMGPEWTQEATAGNGNERRAKM